MYGEQRKFVLGRLEQSRQTNNLLYWQGKPNKPTKEGPLSFVLSFNSQQGPPLSSLSDSDHLTSKTLICVRSQNFHSLMKYLVSFRPHSASFVSTIFRSKINVLSPYPFISFFLFELMKMSTVLHVDVVIPPSIHSQKLNS